MVGKTYNFMHYIYFINISVIILVFSVNVELCCCCFRFVLCSYPIVLAVPLTLPPLDIYSKIFFMVSIHFATPSPTTGINPTISFSNCHLQDRLAGSVVAIYT